MKPPKRPRNVPKKVSQQPAGPAKKFRKGKVPSTRGELSESKNTTRTVQVSRTATGSNLSIASGPVINIVADAHQDAPFVPFRIQDEMDIESPNCNEENALDRPGGALLPLTPQPGPSGVKSPANNNLGMLTVSNEFVSHGSAGSGSLDTRLQVDQSPSYISSVFDPISSHIPVKIKEKIWNGEFIDLNILLKSTRDLVNEQNLEGELVVKGGVLSIVNQKRSPIKSYTHLYSLGNSPINVDEVKKALINYPHQEVARDLIQGLEAGSSGNHSRCKPIHDSGPPLERLKDEADLLLKCSMAPNSWKTYKTAVECLKKFRIIYNYRDIWPVPIDEIAQFIAYLSYKGFSASTVSTYISGLAHTQD
ncbi:unnamed protein product [Mytilus coruscus]|uniref:Core-binding (CB) domain-containing protein n=1 Tax=Mytilus coruscus TaxID=42192 RepID=A0A6J8BBS1_MYTCO|nr:unnamed protein product [Mytilus coruscus]